MRIVFLNPTILLRRPIIELAHHLEQRGHDVQVMSPVDQTQSMTAAHFEKLGVPIVALPSTELKSLLWSIPRLQSYRILWRHMKQSDIIHIWAPYYLLPAAALVFSLWPFGRRPRVILTFDTIPAFSFSFGNLIDWPMRLYHWLVGTWLFRAAKRKTLYGSQLLPFAKQAGLGSNFEIIPTGVDHPEIPSRPDHSGATRILFIGLMNRRKGVAVLLRALAKLQASGLAFEARLVGDGPDRVSFEHQTQSLGLGETVKFLGRSNNVAALYDWSDIFVLPSYGEGLPGVVMEAMSRAVPVIATDIPCLRELIPDASIGTLVPAGDVEQLARAIRRYAENNIERQQIGQQGAKQIRQHFSWSDVVPQYEHLYASI